MSAFSVIEHLLLLFLIIYLLVWSSLFPVICRSENTVYRLVAIAEHRGDCTKGHYVAYVRADGMGHQQINGSKSWFFASDREIRKASVEEVLGCQAYVLVYERVRC